ncbi:ArsR/SmtB family transcription factor [Flavobacterium sp.]|uniref:ArsR/SmtB family transcription factor n=1 Tax=Flavobacterium sp. TaxID=239 RepID=UPI0040344445
MGTTKAELFTAEQNEIASMLKALGHPARIAILQYLLKVNQCVCGDIVGELPLAQATISQHLKEMKTVGLIKGSVEGTAICYCIDEAGIEKIQSYFVGIAEKLDTNKNNCC